MVLAIKFNLMDFSMLIKYLMWFLIFGYFLYNFHTLGAF